MDGRADQPLVPALDRLLRRPWAVRAVMGAILANALILGLETFPALAPHLPLLHALDRVFLAFFVVEIAARLVAHPRAFLRDPWSLFDTAVIAVALVPASGPLQVLRALRVLRVLRLITVVPALRRVVEALLRSLPGMGAIVAVQALILYVFAVMGSALFGATRPALFGDAVLALFTLFQVMTLESWGSIARGLMAEHPWAWLYFTAFILVSTFVVLNLFIAVIGNSLQEVREAEAGPDPAAVELAELRREVAALRRLIESCHQPPG